MMSACKEVLFIILQIKNEKMLSSLGTRNVNSLAHNFAHRAFFCKWDAPSPPPLFPLGFGFVQEYRDGSMRAPPLFILCEPRNVKLNKLTFGGLFWTRVYVMLGYHI